jgi:hypothetical protein
VLTGSHKAHKELDSLLLFTRLHWIVALVAIVCCVIGIALWLDEVGVSFRTNPQRFQAQEMAAPSCQ